MSGVGAFQVSEELLAEVLGFEGTGIEIVAASWGTVGEFGVGGPPCLTLYVRHPSIPDSRGVVRCRPTIRRNDDGTHRFDLNPEEKK